jgi:acetyl esterase/lipase
MNKNPDEMSTYSSLFYGLMKIMRYREINNRRFLEEIASGITRTAGAVPFPPKGLTRRYTVETSFALDSHVFTIRPRAKANGRVILYLHGGAYIRKAAVQHWNFIGAFLRAGYTVVFPDYPLAPRCSWREAHELAHILFQGLMAEYGSKNLVLMGDSAGGGLALALAQRLRDEKGPQPSHIVMLSPWLDVGMNNPAIAAMEHLDPFLPAEGLQAAGASYARDLPVTDPRVSPLYGSFEGLGNMSLFTGTYDLLNPDARLMRDSCAEKGIPLKYFEYPKMLHVWMIFGFPESGRAVGEILKTLDE